MDVLRLLLRVPRGRVTTYAELARAAGAHPLAVARVLAANKEPDKYPCYRVVMSDGRLGGYSGAGGVGEKQRRLEQDGILVVGGRVDLRSCVFSF